MMNRLVLRQAVQKWSSSSTTSTTNGDNDNDNDDDNINSLSSSSSSLKEGTMNYSLLANSILQWFSSHPNTFSTLPEIIVSSK